MLMEEENLKGQHKERIQVNQQHNANNVYMILILAFTFARWHVDVCSRDRLPRLDHEQDLIDLASVLVGLDLYPCSSQFEFCSQFSTHFWHVSSGIYVYVNKCIYGIFPIIAI